MGFVPHQRARTVSKFERPASYFVRSNAFGIPTGYPASGSEPIRCGANEVALIDEIELQSNTTDSNANHTVTLKVNGLEAPINFPGTLDQVRGDRIVWRTRGNLVVQPSQSLAIKAAVASYSDVVIRFRKKRLVDAIRDGDIPGSGSLPNIASTNSVSAGGTAAGTAKQIIPPVSGKSVEVLGLLFTGHNFNAAADNIRLGYWDGTTGNFAANGATIMTAYRRGASSIYAKPLVIGNTDGCIQGPSGYGVYIQSTANMAGATPTADWVVLYRYIPANRIEVASTTGALGATPSAMGKFWVTCESAVTTSVLDLQLNRMFADLGTGVDTRVKIKGWAQSAHVLNDSAAQLLGFGLGNGTVANGILSHGGLGGYIHMLADFAAGNNPIGHLVGQDDTLLECMLSRIPAFAAYQTTATPSLVARCQLAWGRFGGGKILNQDMSGQSQYGIIS